MFIPTGDKVIIFAMHDPDTWYDSPIIRPESTKDRATQGVVKAVGPQVRDVEVGDYVVFSNVGGYVFDDPVEGQRHILLSERGIFFIATPPSTEVSGLYVKLHDSTFAPATSEFTHQRLRETYHKIPRVVQMKHREMMREE